MYGSTGCKYVYMHDEKASKLAVCMPMTTAATWQGQGLDGGPAHPRGEKKTTTTTTKKSN